jgi:hypothetical protein
MASIERKQNFICLLSLLVDLKKVYLRYIFIYLTMNVYSIWLVERENEIDISSTCIHEQCK